RPVRLTCDALEPRWIPVIHIFEFQNFTYSVRENVGQATITVERLVSSSGTASVDYATADDTATAGHDYTTASGTLTFASGQTSATFTVPITYEGTPEGDEDFTASLSNPSPGY